VTPETVTQAQYAEEIGVLWTGLSRTLTRLDRIAAEPEQLEDPQTVVALRRLQYALHLASEHAYGVEPPPGSRTAHAELADALSCARDATAEVAETVGDWGADGVWQHIHEWRGALFRVRLARLRLAMPTARAAAEEPPARPAVWRPAVAFLLALMGALAFAGGATLGDWPIWAAGLLTVCASVLAYRP